MPRDLIGIPDWAGPVMLGLAIALWPWLARALVDMAFAALTATFKVVFDALEWVCFPETRGRSRQP